MAIASVSTIRSAPPSSGPEALSLGLELARKTLRGRIGLKRSEERARVAHEPSLEYVTRRNVSRLFEEAEGA